MFLYYEFACTFLQFQNSQATIGTLSKDCEDTKSLLAREKEKGERLMIEQKEMRAQLEVKKQELKTTKREMESLMKLVLKMHVYKLVISFFIYRLKEESLTSSHKAEIESMHSHYRHQSQTLLSDFKKAKQILTAKLEEKERRLEVYIFAVVWLHLYAHNMLLTDALWLVNGYAFVGCMMLSNAL